MICPYSSGKFWAGGAFLPPHPVVTAAVGSQLVAVGVTGEPKPLGVTTVVGAEPNVAGLVENPALDAVVLPYASPLNPPPTKLGWLLTLTCPCTGGT